MKKWTNERITAQFLLRLKSSNSEQSTTVNNIYTLITLIKYNAKIDELNRNGANKRLWSSKEDKELRKCGIFTWYNITQ